MSEIVFSVSVPFNVMWPHSSAHNVFIVGGKEPRDFGKGCLLRKSATEQDTGEQGNAVTVHYNVSSIPLECRNLPAWRPLSSLHWFQFHTCCCDFTVGYPAGWKLSCFFKLLPWWMICSLGYPPCGFPGRGLFWVLIGAKITNGHPQALPSWRLRFRE